MRRITQLPRRGHGARSGFSLIELLVVIAIIAVLASLGASAALKLMGSQQNATSKQTVQTVNKLLQQHWSAVIAQAQEDAKAGKIPTTVMTMAGNDAQRAKVIFIKLRLQREFPMSFKEILQPASGSLPARDEYVKALNRAGVQASSTPKPTEMAACLLLALSAGHGGVSQTTDLLGSNAIKDTDGDGMNEIVDAWGTPLGFYRWPTSFTDLNPSGAAAGFNDPVDPLGTLSQPAWCGASGQGTTFSSLCHPVAANKSYKLIPIVASAGPDLQLGLSANMAPNSGSSNYDYDNIYSNRP